MIYEIKDYENIDVGVKAYVIVSFFFGTMIQNQEYTNPFIDIILLRYYSSPVHSECSISFDMF